MAGADAVRVAAVGGAAPSARTSNGLEVIAGSEPAPVRIACPSNSMDVSAQVIFQKLAHSGLLLERYVRDRHDKPKTLLP